MKSPTPPKPGRPTKITGKAGTVTIYATAGSFTLAHAAAGQRKREKRATWPAALERAGEILKSLETGVAHVRTLTAAEVATIDHCLELLAPSQTPLSKAISEYVAILGTLSGLCSPLRAAEIAAAELARGEIKPALVRDVVEAFLEEKKRHFSLAHYVNTKSRLKGFVADFNCRIGEIATAKISQWLAKGDIAPLTRRQRLATVQSLFSWAKAQGHLPRDRATEAAHVSAPPVPPTKITLYTPEELRTMLEASDPRARAFIVLGALCGLRGSEIFRLSWEDVNLESGRITVAADRTKTARRRMVPICPAAREWLSTIPDRTGPLASVCYDHWHREIMECIRASGVQNKMNALRHSYCTYRLEITQSREQVALECGNSPQMLIKHYADLTDPQTAQAWFNVMPPR